MIVNEKNNYFVSLDDSKFNNYKLLNDAKEKLISLISNKALSSDPLNVAQTKELLVKVAEVKDRELKTVTCIDQYFSQSNPLNHVLKFFYFALNPVALTLANLESEVQYLAHIYDLKTNTGKTAFEEYEELVVRLPDEEKKRIDDFVVDPLLCDQIEQDLIGGNWGNIGARLTSREELPKQLETLTFHALALVKGGKLSVKQFSTFMLYLSACKQHGVSNVKIIPIFNKEGVNPRADQLIAETMIKGEDNFGFLPKKLSASYEFNRQKFYLNMQVVPKSEQYLFMIPDVSGHYSPLRGKQPKVVTITQRINVEIGKNQFGRIKEISKGKMQRLMPSIDVMQSYLNSTTPHSLQINPVVGNSSVEQIVLNGKSNTRDMQIPYAAEPEGFIPYEADTFKVVDEYDMAHHDFYHSLICANISPVTQRAFIRMAELFTEEKLDKLAIKDEKLKERFQVRFIWGLIDMEHLGDSKSPDFFLVKTTQLFSNFRGSLPVKNKSEYKKIVKFTRDTIQKDFSAHGEEWAKLGVNVNDWRKFQEKFN